MHTAQVDNDCVPNPRVSVTPRPQVRDLATVAASRAHTVIVMHPGFATSHEAAEAAKASTAMALASLCSADGGGHGLGDSDEGEGGWWRPMPGGNTAGRAQAASASLTLTGSAAGRRLRSDLRFTSNFDLSKSPAESSAH